MSPRWWATRWAFGGVSGTPSRPEKVRRAPRPALGVGYPDVLSLFCHNEGKIDAGQGLRLWSEDALRALCHRERFANSTQSLASGHRGAAGNAQLSLPQPESDHDPLGKLHV